MSKTTQKQLTLIGLPLLAMLIGLAWNARSPLGVALRPIEPSVRRAAEKTAVVTPIQTSVEVIAAKTELPQLSSTPQAEVAVNGGTRAPKKGTVYSHETLELTAALSTEGGTSASSSEVAVPVGLTLSEAEQLMTQPDVVLVDGRPSAVYKAGHIPGAVSLPLAELAQRIGEFRSQVAPERHLLIYCSNRNCGIAAKLSVLLKNQHHYPKVSYMYDGYNEWRLAHAESAAAGAAR